MGQKEEINIQPEQNEETRIQKNEERLRNLQVRNFPNLQVKNIFKHPKIQIIEIPEEKRKSKKLTTDLKN